MKIFSIASIGSKFGQKIPGDPARTLYVIRVQFAQFSSLEEKL